MKINHHLILRLLQCGGGVRGFKLSLLWSRFLTERWLWGYFHCRRVRPSRRQEHDFVMFVMSEHWLTQHSLKRFPPCSSSKDARALCASCTIAQFAIRIMSSWRAVWRNAIAAFLNPGFICQLYAIIPFPSLLDQSPVQSNFPSGAKLSLWMAIVRHIV